MLGSQLLGQDSRRKLSIRFVYHSNIQEESMAKVLLLLTLIYYHTIKLQTLLAPPLNRHD